MLLTLVSLFPTVSRDTFASRVEHRRQLVVQLPQRVQVVPELPVDGLQDLALLLLRVQGRVELLLQGGDRLLEGVVLAAKALKNLNDKMVFRSWQKRCSKD